jgi:hypothetical protein
MRQLGIIFVFASLLGCGASPEKDKGNGFGQVEQEYNSNPPKPFICIYPMEPCGLPYCSNLQWDNLNCGVCGNECDISIGEFCNNFVCRSIEDYGFDNDILKRGPKKYDVKRDLPRPNPVQTKP